MSYYDHATAMAFKLGPWRAERDLRNYEIEALACAQRAPAKVQNKRSLLTRCKSILLAYKKARTIERASKEN